MPTNKKPRKAYRPRPVLKPLGMKNTVKLELPGHIGLLALGQGWLDISHIRDIGAHAALVERIARKIGEASIVSQARSVIAIMLKCEERFERIGRPGTTGDEMRTIREVLAVSMPWLTAQPNHLIHECSMTLLRTFDRAVEEAGHAA